ncbi:heavy-metal-associated domain-containing protein [Dendrosporobacter sp. 1207_IL3150]|uniref:heavy-metal-associated domain-containing protein n=1 Tax=Dendrosporobacter sp. 1207_IL3150 TaxID=3084054 RepID=UPI002FDAB39C
MASKKTVYTVGGLKGNHCRDRIEHTLSHLPGVTNVDVNVGSKKVNVAYDPDVIASGYIEETLQTLGYSIQG